MAGLREIATSQNIKSDFKRTGIFPLNRYTVLSDVLAHIRFTLRQTYHQQHKIRSERNRRISSAHNLSCPEKEEVTPSGHDYLTTVSPLYVRRPLIKHTAVTATIVGMNSMSPTRKLV